jgi:predicted Fe-S protein YdhL (DUF1289 family)
MQDDTIKDFDPHAHVGPLPSPCINVCQMDFETRLCKGCLRTIDEISQWSNADEQFKRAVWLQIQQRQKAIEK